MFGIGRVAKDVVLNYRGAGFQVVSYGHHIARGSVIDKLVAF